MAGMALGLGLGMSRPSAGSTFTPASLGASLLGFWDAERTDLLALDTGTVTTWTDTVAGYAPTQPTAGSKPAYSATSFNGRPGITFDGVDDFLSLESVPFPSAASPSEIWMLLRQDTLPADTAVRLIITYGGIVGSSRRAISRAVVTGVNVMQATVGAAGTSVTANAPGDFSGAHVVRATFSATTETPYLDGNAGTPVAAVPATGTTRIRLGANTPNTPTSFFQGVANSILITAPLSADQATALTAYLKARGGLA